MDVDAGDPGRLPAGPQPSESAERQRDASPDDYPTLKRRDAQLGVIVIFAGARRREHAGLSALSRREESRQRDLRTIGMARVDAPDQIVRARIVVDERDALSGGD